MISENKSRLRYGISWLNVWFSIGIITGMIILGDLTNVFDLGLYPDDFINTIIKVIFK